MSEVLLEQFDGVALVTLNAPERRNALTVEMAAELSEALRSIGADPGVRAVVVTGSGSAFCAGATRTLLAEAAQDPLSSQSRSNISTIYQAFIDLGSLALPTIAAVNGPAVGAGLNLAMAATLRLVSEKALLVSGFPAIGLHPGGGHLHLIARNAGREAAAALAIFGLAVAGPEAVAKGLAWECLPPDRLVDRAIEVAGSVARDRELVEATLASLEVTAGPPALPWAATIELERGRQQWSMGRR